jgi:beta-glucosidase
LPLNKEKIKTIALIGPDAYPAVPVGGGSAQVVPFHAVSMLEALGASLGTRTTVTYANGLTSVGRAAILTDFQLEENGSTPGLKFENYDNETLSGTPTETGTRLHISLGIPFDIGGNNSDEVDRSGAKPKLPSSQRWTGYYAPKTAGLYDIFVQQGSFVPAGFRMYLDGKLLFDDWDNEKFAIAQASASLSRGPHKIVLEHHAGASSGVPFVRMGIVPQHDWVDAAAEELAAKADVAVVAIGFDPKSETEGWDRTFQLPPGQDELIQRIAARNKRTIVIVTSGGGVDMSPWIDKVAGVIEAWYPGQEGGTALAQILFGDVNPSGHLAATFERSWNENPVYGNYYPAKGTNRVEYKEGIFVGYRGYEHNHVEPQFHFGFGLSYTTFKYSNLTSDEHGVSFEVTNTGSRAGDAVPQVYISAEHPSVPWPPKELKGFSRVTLQPGETKNVHVALNSRSFATWQRGSWRAEKGDYDVLVGASSEQIELRGKIKLESDLPTM